MGSSLEGPLATPQPLAESPSCPVVPWFLRHLLCAVQGLEAGGGADPRGRTAGGSHLQVSRAGCTVVRGTWVPGGHRSKDLETLDSEASATPVSVGYATPQCSSRRWGKGSLPTSPGDDRGGEKASGTSISEIGLFRPTGAGVPGPGHHPARLVMRAPCLSW